MASFLNWTTPHKMNNDASDRSVVGTSASSGMQPIKDASGAGLGNVLPAGHIRPAKHLNAARELHLKFSK